MALISIVIPVYNCEEYLRECLDSILNQSFKDIEVYCVDDGSTDTSVDILTEYQQTRLLIFLQNINNALKGYMFYARKIQDRALQGTTPCSMLRASMSFLSTAMIGLNPMLWSLCTIKWSRTTARY